jgi:FKBP-type peptidyl-prolyl cis-trans isomerase FkpA
MALTRSLLVFALTVAAFIGATGCSSSPTAPSGHDVPSLQIIDVIAGTGVEATNGRQLTVHYSGFLYEPSVAGNRGLRFDTSRDDNIPYVFVLGVRQVIQGWDDGIRGMKVGGQRTLVIPSALAYGAAGRPNIPPHSALVFDIELIDAK